MDEVIPVTPKVTAILLAHNQASELRRALTALEGSQQREQLEILVVDCASEDDTEECTQGFPGVTVLRLPQHFGATKALNIATRTARGEFLFLLSPDVEVAADTVAGLVERLDAHADTLAVCPLLRDEQGQPAPHVQALPDRESLTCFCATGEVRRPALDLTQESVTVAYAGREALLVRKQFVAGMNYFDERFGEYWADADLAMQIRRTGRKVRLYPGIQATWHAAGRPASDDVTHQSDRIVGAAQLLSKHQGFFAGLGFRWAAIFSALIHFDFALFSALMGGTKLGGEASRSYPT